ncbi:isochorismatase family cysteine hydrolase [Streptomyces sp. HNM0645]|uniref:cysteine hydrolase family protein n=1 Tax=Streptomyces sp. HNM0645 TaxID=2782343 RepID=UPI0024B73CDC|nr:isochorismatase family cysteine hydrolase [Streptomyces sp. HNM0645]MDI9886793.1 isochorismatase family cysteine hydrolase [Streptomyces sp. HNM0645]
MTRVHTALVLIDLQRWIVDRPWQPVSGDAVADACARLREHFEAADSASVVLVRYVRADGADGGLAAAPNQLVPGLAARAGEHVVTKHGLDAFEDTDLHDHLRQTGVTKIVLAGLTTAHGVASTAATALRLGYEVVVVSDATASETDAQHREALDRMTAAGARTGLVGSLVTAEAVGG